MAFSFPRLFGAVAGAGAVTWGSSLWYRREESPHTAMCVSKDEAGRVNKKLPFYTKEEVEKHNSVKGDGGVWVTYKNGVYDVTAFVKEHPGGEKRIMLAAGSSIEKWWNIFTIHDDDAVRDILERHRIGNLTGYVPVKVDVEAMWKDEPKRSPGLRVLSARPFNAESPEGILDEFITPNDLFFVRGHMPVPALKDDSSFEMCVDGEGIKPQCFTVDELKSRFPHHSVVNTMQCGGNRRTEMAAKYADGESGKGVKGLAWTNGAIGTARWTGVWLRDVIAACQEAPLADPGKHHVQFEGADHDAAGHFRVSIPYKMAMREDADVLVAFEMNGEPLPPDHGYPLRAIVPGTVGVRNCKFLQRVTVQPFEAQSVWQQNDYKNFPSWETRPDPAYESVYYMPVQSSITDVAYDPSADAIALKAYALGGGGSGIQRVEMSFDGGRTFEKDAKLVQPPAAAGIDETAGDLPERRDWAWRQVSAAVPLEDIVAKPQELEDGAQRFNVCIRAITKDNQVQPAVASYNFRGLLYNGYSCRDVDIS